MYNQNNLIQNNYLILSLDDKLKSPDMAKNLKNYFETPLTPENVSNCNKLNFYKVS